MKLLTTLTIKILVVLFLINKCVSGQTDSVKTGDQKNSDTVFVMQKSAWGAVLRSAILPGWGQIYNESYWKVPIVWGTMGWFVYAWLDNNRKYNNYNDLYHQFGDNYSINYKNYRNFYRDQRDTFAIYLCLTYFLTLVDAYVDAHLFDFSVDENQFTGLKMLNLHFRF